MLTRPLPPWIAGVVGGGALLLLAWLERQKPLRRSVEPKLRREARNLTVAGISAIAVVLAERPIVMPLAALVERRNLGLLRLFGFPLWLELAAALVLMDYTFYVWHVLMHRIPLLWRFHLVHHVDLDLDASTALRFHFTEMLASIPWRAGQVALIGLTPLSFSIWQCVFLLSILFHHSNMELPISWERRLNKLIVTPRMHGIHHSIVERETNSNWSSGLTVWDWLHGTLRLNVPQTEVTIGVPAFQEPKAVTLPRVLAMPFEPLPPTWEFPIGVAPKPHVSEASEAPQTTLLP
jgi:sterol desaturase/sphingolipid hydroxylase (fatty acid hydroxylase superfamily)